MDFVGAWLRQLVKAGTAAALVPAAMLAAVAVVLIGAGGFGGLGSIGQLLSGPEVTPAERIASRDPADGRDVAPVAPADADAQPDAPRGSDAPARSGARGSAPDLPATARPPRRRPAVDPDDPIARLPRPPLPPPPPPPPAASRPPTLKDRTQVLGGKLKDTVGDVGTAVQEIVDGLGQTLGRIVKPPPQSPR